MFSVLVHPDTVKFKGQGHRSNLPPGESRWVWRRDRQTDGQTDGRPLHYAFNHGRGQRIND